MRKGKMKRKTSETRIEISFIIDGKGRSEIRSGMPFMDHMLELFCKHGLFDIRLKAKGDLRVDNHHTAEDIGIVLGQALLKALGNRKSINRYAEAITPMDEALSLVSIDISNRPLLVYEVPVERRKLGDLDSEAIQEFFQGFVSNSRVTLHIRMLDGSNGHHIFESIFKGFGRALRRACEKDPRNAGIPSTKGSL
jgi:imidazoleglycerol-phosphate dehydratase